MPLKVCVYEDEKFAQFYPLTCLRPVYTLRAGILPLFRRFERFFEGAECCLSARNQLSPFLAETYRDYPVNFLKKGEGDFLFLNGRIRDYGDLPELVAAAGLSTVFTNQGQVVAVLFQGPVLDAAPAIGTQAEYQQFYDSDKDRMGSTVTTATLYERAWDIMEDIETEIAADFAYLRQSLSESQNVRIHEGASIINSKDVYFGEDVEVLPGSVIDASGGPVYLGDLTRVEPHASVVGPCYVGPNSIVLAGKLSGSSIGHTCRVGGEVEETIFHSYVNKYHAGFIGHSYVGPWVNFGAMTTNSDLKNNYSTIRVTIGGESVDTGSIKVGSFIGDHTKFGIGTLLNTGITIGVCCNIFGGGLVFDKEVPSFSWGSTNAWDKHQFDKAIETAARTAGRRNCELSDREVELLRLVAEDKIADDGVMRF